MHDIKCEHFLSLVFHLLENINTNMLTTSSFSCFFLGPPQCLIYWRRICELLGFNWKKKQVFGSTKNIVRHLLALMCHLSSIYQTTFFLCWPRCTKNISLSCISNVILSLLCSCIFLCVLIHFCTCIIDNKFSFILF